MGVAPEQLVTLHQVHSADAVVLTGPPDGPIRADAMVTATPGLRSRVLTADCQPVLFADAAAGVMGAAHAGWKGALDGVLEATLDAMEGLGADRAADRAPSSARRSARPPTRSARSSWSGSWTPIPRTRASSRRARATRRSSICRPTGFTGSGGGRGGRALDAALHLCGRGAILLVPPQRASPRGRLRAAHLGHPGLRRPGPVAKTGRTPLRFATVTRRQSGEVRGP